MAKLLLIVFSCLVCFACKSKSSFNRLDSHMAIPEEMIFSYNSDSTLLLEKEISPVTAENPFPGIKFKVIDLVKRDTIFNGFEQNADVVWYDKHHLKITRIPEMITADQQPEDNIFILNPIKNKLVRLSNYKIDQTNEEK
jgi:hypothetical protein